MTKPRFPAFTRLTSLALLLVGALAGCPQSPVAPPATDEAPATPAAEPAKTTPPPTMKMTTPIPASITTPDTVQTSIGTLEYFDGVPKKATVETVYDYLDRSRAVQVFLNSIPAMSMLALREGQAQAGCDATHKVCIFDTLMDSKSLVLTGNTSTMYAIGFLDLKRMAPRSSTCLPRCWASSTTWRFST